MRTAKFPVILLVCLCLITIIGCVSTNRYEDAKVQNLTQQNRIAELESQLSTHKLQLEQAKRQLATLKGRSGTNASALEQEIAAFEKAIQRKNALIAALRQQLLGGAASLPVELDAMLQDFAAAHKMVSYEPASSVLKLKSDLLFELGSDKVTRAAVGTIASLCKIVNSEQGKKFDIIIAGHTDDVRIARPRTRRKHPTNWHLSAHRAISVLRIMTKNNVTSERLSVRGFGQFRPIVPNKPNRKGNPQNRRVEIYVVPAGA